MNDINSNEPFKPLLEGQLYPENSHPIFAKALTHGERSIRLPVDFAEQPDHLHQACRLATAHHRKYVSIAFPIQHYAYFISPTRSARISITGQVLGIFKDIPANPSFTIGEKRYEVGKTK